MLAMCYSAIVDGNFWGDSVLVNVHTRLAFFFCLRLAYKGGVNYRYLPVFREIL